MQLCINSNIYLSVEFNIDMISEIEMSPLQVLTQPAITHTITHNQSRRITHNPSYPITHLQSLVSEHSSRRRRRQLLM